MSGTPAAPPCVPQATPNWCWGTARVSGAPTAGLRSRSGAGAGISTCPFSSASCFASPPPSSSSSSESRTSSPVPPLFQLLAPELEFVPDLENLPMARAEAMAARHFARGSKWSRRPLERSCSVDARWVVSHWRGRVCKPKEGRTKEDRKNAPDGQELPQPSNDVWDWGPEEI